MKVIQAVPALCKDCGGPAGPKAILNDAGVVGFKVECVACEYETHVDVSLTAVVMLWNLYNTGAVDIRVSTIKL